MQTNKLKRDDHRFDKYIQKLKQHGVKVHPSLQPAIFTLNNGLQYPGLRLRSAVVGEQNLVTIPVSLLLTSHKARQQPELQGVFQHSFYSMGQDRILITYLLWLYWKKQIGSVWFEMVELFSKEIDILSFWCDEQLDRFSDKSVKRAAVLEQVNFGRQWQQFEDVIQARSQFFVDKMDIFTRDNYQWIYVHAVSRCFGSYMNSTYFTPFCQFFNHHCVDVSYQCVTREQHQKLLTTQQLVKQSIIQLQPSISIQATTESQVQQQTQTGQQLIQHNNIEHDTTQPNDQQLSQTSSISSGNSVDYIEDGDFNYWQIQSYKIKWGGKVSFDLKDKQTKIIQQQYQQTITLLEQNLIWNGHSLVIIGQLIQKINILNNQYLAGRKKFIPTTQEFTKVKTLIENYRTQASAFYRLMGSKYDPRIQTQSNINNLSYHHSTTHQPNINNLSSHNSTTNYVKTSTPPIKDYQFFLMDAGPKASFKQNQQIYFRYGHLSNRTMLIRYGCCIENNRYEYVWMKVSLAKVLSPYPDLFERIQEKGMSINYKLKLKVESWPYDLYLWFKLKKWQFIRHTIHQVFYPHDIDQEISIFQKILTLVQQKIPSYSTYPSYQDLQNPQIQYHEYFTRVYHKEKVNILQKHVAMCQYVLNALNLMKQSKKLIRPKELSPKLFKKQLKGYWKILLKGQITF